MTRLKQLNARLPERTHLLLRALSERTGMTITQLLIQAVEEYARKLKITL